MIQYYKFITMSFIYHSGERNQTIKNLLICFLSFNTSLASSLPFFSLSFYLIVTPFLAPFPCYILISSLSFFPFCQFFSLGHILPAEFCYHFLLLSDPPKEDHTHQNAKGDSANPDKRSSWEATVNFPKLLVVKLQSCIALIFSLSAQMSLNVYF